MEADFSEKLGITSTHTGTQEITGKLQPRFNAGNLPDIVDDSGAQKINVDVLYKNGQLLDLTEVLDAPSVDDPATKVRDTLIPGTLDPGMQEGKVVALNYIYTVWGCGTPASSSRTTAGRSPRPGTTSSPSARTPSRRASAASPTRASYRTTSTSPSWT